MPHQKAEQHDAKQCVVRHGDDDDAAVELVQTTDYPRMAANARILLRSTASHSRLQQANKVRSDADTGVAHRAECRRPVSLISEQFFQVVIIIISSLPGARHGTH
eukprot:scpid84438/ scgid9259/ 